jgi:hypothetical protein
MATLLVSGSPQKKKHVACYDIHSLDAAVSSFPSSKDYMHTVTLWSQPTPSAQLQQMVNIFKYVP